MIPPYIVAVSQQRYETDILLESVILGNEAIFKCSIPSFLADFVSVVSWEDSEANIWHAGRSNFGNLAGIGLIGGYCIEKKALKAEKDKIHIICTVFIIFIVLLRNLASELLLSPPPPSTIMDKMVAVCQKRWPFYSIPSFPANFVSFFS